MPNGSWQIPHEMVHPPPRAGHTLGWEPAGNILEILSHLNRAFAFSSRKWQSICKYHLIENLAGIGLLPPANGSSPFLDKHPGTDPCFLWLLRKWILVMALWYVSYQREFSSCWCVWGFLVFVFFFPQCCKSLLELNIEELSQVPQVSFWVFNRQVQVLCMTQGWITHPLAAAQ